MPSAVLITSAEPVPKEWTLRRPAKTELLTIDADTTIRRFKKDLKGDAAYYRLAGGLLAPAGSLMLPRTLSVTSSMPPMPSTIVRIPRAAYLATTASVCWW